MLKGEVATHCFTCRCTPREYDGHLFLNQTQLNQPPLTKCVGSGLFALTGQLVSRRIGEKEVVSCAGQRAVDQPLPSLGGVYGIPGRDTGVVR